MKLFQLATSAISFDGGRRSSQKAGSSKAGSSSSPAAAAPLSTPRKSSNKQSNSVVSSTSSRKKSCGVDANRSSNKSIAVVVPRSLNVLVATNNMVNCKLAANMLKRLGHEATLVESGTAAVDRIKENAQSAPAFDVVMMDLCMATSNVQTLGFPSNIHMIAMTGSKVPGNFLELGFRSWVKKPLQMKELQDKLEHVHNNGRQRCGGIVDVVPGEGYGQDNRKAQRNASMSTAETQDESSSNSYLGDRVSGVTPRDALVTGPTSPTGSLCKPTSPSSTMIEILPGYSVPLRGADEIRNYVRREEMVPAMCFHCDLELFWSVQDAEYVLCPKCKVIQPLTATEEGIVCGTWKGGVGLGITNETLKSMKDDICQENLLQKPNGSSSAA